MTSYKLIWGLPLLGLPPALGKALLRELSQDVACHFEHCSPDPIRHITALRRHCRIRCINALCSLFPGSTVATLETLVVSATAPTLPTDQQQLYSCFVPLVAQALWNRHATRLTPTHCFHTRALLWNLNSFAPPAECVPNSQGVDSYNNKLRYITSALKRGPVLLVETKWKSEHAGRYRQSLPGTFIAATPAVEGPSGGASGGAAIIMPTHNRVAPMVPLELVPGFAAGIEVNDLQSPVLWVVCYFRPGTQLTILRALHAALAKRQFPGRLYVGCDLNRADQRHPYEWELFKHQFGLVDVAPDLPTYSVDSNTVSCLDRWLLCDLAVLQQRMLPKIITSRRGGPGQHSRVYLRITRVKTPSAQATFQCIPAKALSPGTQQGQDLMRRLRRAIVPFFCDPVPQGTDTPDSGPATDPLIGNCTIPPHLAGIAWGAVKAAAWTWWRSQAYAAPDSYGKAYHVLRKAASQQGAVVQVPCWAVALLNAKLKLPMPLLGLPKHADGQTVSLASAELRRALHVDDLEELHQQSYHKQPAPYDKLLHHPKPSPIWQRLKTLAPVQGTSLTHLIRTDGTHAVTAPEVEEEVRSTRPFWLLPPPPLCPQLLAVLPEYTTLSTSMEHVALPAASEFIQVVRNSGDSATGTDGVPYGAYRLIDVHTSHLLASFLSALFVCPTQVSSPNPLLVWIPKADAGPRADNWRPLGMPSTFHRMLAAGVYFHIVRSLPGLLHPSQALLNQFREPQGNYSDAQEFLKGGERKRTRLGGVLLTDFVKAFELVNPDWIIAVLIARRAPLWLLTYVRYLLYGRRVVPKIHGTLLEALKVLVGVDMGSAMSPLLFCIALDPLLVYLNRIPRVIGVRAYMDDNQIWGSCPSGSVEWLQIVEATVQKLHTAGLQVTQHTCCVFFASPCQSDSPSCGDSSWRRAASSFLDQRPLACVAHTAAGTAISREQLLGIAAKSDPQLLASLLRQKCKCKTKCSWLPDRPLSPDEIVNLDDTLWGARILSAEAQVLGLQLCAPYGTGLSAAVVRTAVFGAAHIAKTFQKGHLKATARTRLLKQAITPLPQQTKAYTAWIQSVTYYAASVTRPPAAFRQDLYRLYSSLIFNLHWLQAEHAHAVLRLLRIASGPTPGAALDLATIGYAFRRYTPSALALTPGAVPQHLRTRVISVIKKAQPYASPEEWRTLVDEIHATDAAHMHLLPKVMRRIKVIIQQGEEHAALTYLLKRSGKSFPTYIQPLPRWLALAECSVRLVPPHARIALVRWWLRAEADDAQLFRGTNLPVPPFCGICQGTSPATSYPWGKTQYGICSAHPDYKYMWRHQSLAALDAWLEANLGGFDDPDLDQPDMLPEPEPPLPVCVFCRQGPNTLEHLQRFCNVTLSILSAALGRYACYTDWYPEADFELVIVAHTVHAIRRELLARHAYSGGRAQHRIFVLPGDTLALVTRIVAEISAALPAHWERSPLLLSPAATANSCSGEFYHARAVPKPHFSPEVVPRHSTKHMQIVTIRRVAPGTQLLFTHARDYPWKGAFAGEQWLPPPRPVGNSRPTCRLMPATCACGGKGWLVTCDTIMTQGAPLTIAPAAITAWDIPQNPCSQQQLPREEDVSVPPVADKLDGDGGSAPVVDTVHLILQFDGSCRRPGGALPCAGAGVVAWLLTNDSVHIVEHAAIPLPEATNAQEAEAGGASAAVAIAVKLVPKLSPTHIEFQGDNKGVVGYWTGHSRFRHLRINNLLVQAREVSLFQLPHAKWAYIPRECNGTADHLAGLASQLVQTARDEDTADHLAPFSPLNCTTLQLVHVTGQTAAAWSVDHTAPFVLPELSDASSWHAVALLQRYFPRGYTVPCVSLRDCAPDSQRCPPSCAVRPAHKA